MEQFLIGNILVEIDYIGMPVISEGNLRLFCYNGSWEGERIQLTCNCESLSNYITTEFDRENLLYGLYSYQGEPLLVYHWGNILHGFAVWPRRFAVTFDSRMYNQVPLREDWFFSVCAFHRQLLLRNACVIHASYVDVGGEAILFTGPSNIGKSTQAALWVQHRNAKIVNGDRVLVQRIGDKWHAFGYPSCGTSGICINQDMPIRAIVVLTQHCNNSLDLNVSLATKIRNIVAATEFYPWDSDEFDMALKIASDIAMNIPVIRLNCRPDEGAVNILKEYLDRCN